MALLNLHLTDGFAGDHVIVSVDGTKVFERDGVTTNELLGKAASLAAVTTATDRPTITLELPGKSVLDTITVDLGKGSHVPIALESGQIRYSVEKKIGFA